jgi:hypothetical protein
MSISEAGPSTDAEEMAALVLRIARNRQALRSRTAQFRVRELGGP